MKNKKRYNNAYADICKDDDDSIPCPDLIMIGSTQVPK